MKTLYLIRHAKSSWSDPDLKDFDRPLNNRGKRDVKIMSKGLSKRIDCVDVVLSSTAKRAVATTKAFITESNIQFKHIEKEDSLYNANSKQVLKLIGKQDKKYDSIAIVGHNPSLTNLANKIGNVTIDNVPTTGIIAFEFDIDKWENILKKEGKMLFFDYPKKLKASKAK